MGIAAQFRKDVLPFVGATEHHLCIAQTFCLLNAWHNALAGKGRLNDALELLLDLTGGTKIALYRYKGTGLQMIAGYAGNSAAAGMTETGSRSFNPLLPRPQENCSAGSVLRPGKPDPTDPQYWDQRHGNTCTGKDACLFILETDQEHVDALELVFGDGSVDKLALPAELLSKALADAWAMRAPGLVTRLITERHRRTDQSSEESIDILGPMNPAGLSRAELRVAHLLTGGQKPKEMATELGLSVSTIRSHLRSIYAKTNCGSQVELLSLIITVRTSA